MTEFILNDPIAFRGCILFEFLGGKKIYTCYRNMCSILRKNDIDYVEFEFWFMRFANGKLDLDYDRSLEPKTRTFLNMPILVLNKIFGELNSKVRHLVSQTCQNLRAVIQDPGFKQCFIEIQESYTTLHFDCRLNYYSNCLADEVFSYGDIQERWGDQEPDKKYENKKYHMKMVLKDLKSFFSIQMLRLERLYIDALSEKYVKDFELMLKSLNQKIYVKNVTIWPAKQEVLLLPYLDVEGLEELYLKMDHSLENSEEVEKTKQRLEQLLEMEQCQKMGMLKLDFYNIGDVTQFPIELFLCCPRFTLHFPIYDPPSVETLMRFIKTLLKSVVLEFFHIDIYWGYDIETVKTQLAPLTTAVPENPNFLHFPITNSNEFFEIQLNKQNIQIERKH